MLEKLNINISTQPYFVFDSNAEDGNLEELKQFIMSSE